MLKWYALYTNPRAEKKAAAALAEKGFEAYLPLLTTLKQWSDRKKKVQEPLFKSYLFIKADPERHFYDVLSVPGIVKFVKIGNETVPVREEIINAIKLSLMHFDQVEIAAASFKRNQPVKIVAGPLAGIAGYVKEAAGSQYFAVIIEQLGASLLVKVPAAHMLPAK